MYKNLKEINTGKGFLTLPKIDNNVMDFISLAIKETLDELIIKNQLNKNIHCKGIDSYKYLSNDEWTSILNKKSRSFKKKYAIPISNFFKKYLEKILGSEIEFSDELSFGFPCLSFRIIRPLNENDIGSLHADQWFIDIGVTPIRKAKIKSQLLKFWMPIEVEAETSNLLLIPNSHKDKNKYEYELIKTNNGIKPLIKNNFNKNQIYMIKNKNGYPLIFNMNLIHGGAINKSKNCRVSIEFEFFASI